MAIEILDGLETTAQPTDRFLKSWFRTRRFAGSKDRRAIADHVFAVGEGLRREGIAGGRRAVSMIVGRDPNLLDRAGVCRAAIESLAENYSDGVVAPAFYYALFGLPGLFAYKMLNTADSMIGHKTPRYREFGWASARLDDLANWPAARLSILLIAAGAWIRRGTDACLAALHVAARDGGLHRHLHRQGCGRWRAGHEGRRRRRLPCR